MNGKAKDCVVVASEKADFIADRIAAGLPAPEIEMRKLARYLREIAAEMDRPRTTRGTPIARTGSAARVMIPPRA
jgi:hypothetical protein